MRVVVFAGIRSVAVENVADAALAVAGDVVVRRSTGTPAE
jgi:hypothetical protein